MGVVGRKHTQGKDQEENWFLKPTAAAAQCRPATHCAHHRSGHPEPGDQHDEKDGVIRRHVLSLSLILPAHYFTVSVIASHTFSFCAFFKKFSFA